MRSQTIFSLGDPGTFDITDKDDPLYYIARFSHEMSENFFNLQTAGFKFQQMESTDYGNFEDAYDNIVGDIEDWYDEAVEASMSELPIPAPPALPDLTALLPILLGNPWLVMLVKFGIQIVLYWLRKRLEAGTDVTEVSAVLRKALLLPDPANGEISILELLAATPIEIILSKYGDFQDVALSRRVE